jgi:hypothetical protein
VRLATGITRDIAATQLGCLWLFSVFIQKFIISVMATSIARVQEILQMTAQDQNHNEQNKVVQAMQHESGVEADLRNLSKFIREQIFFVFVHDFKDDKDDCLSADGEVCQEFIESYFDVEHNERVQNPYLQNATEEEIRGYLKWLWKEGLKPTRKGRGNIRRDLSNEKSAVYAAISEAFKSKFNQLSYSQHKLQCITLT